MSNAFAGASNMTYMATDTPDLRLVTDMTFMFDSATAFDGDISSWDVSSVTNMAHMFRAATSFNQPLNDWDVSSVNNTVHMFRAATSFNQTLNDWDVSSVTDMGNMFLGATDFNQPLNDWDVSSVTYMSYMFSSATSFDGDISAWDVSSVIAMNDMFNGATDFNRPLNAWDVSSVTYMNYMFQNAAVFNQPLNAWDVSSVTYMEGMFSGATSFDQDLSGWYVVQDTPVLTTNAMFPIRAQNGYLDGLMFAYSVDDTRFVMDDKTLSLNSTNLPPAGMYPLDITAPAVLGEPNAVVEGHTGTLIVTVKGEHRPFITTWRTTLQNQEITINFVGSGMNISWGDGMTETNVSGTQSHTYATASDYEVSVTGALTGLTLDRPDDFVGRLVPELASIDQWGGISWTNMSNAFAGASNMVYIATDTPDLSLVTDMSFMFESAIAFDGDLSSWDVSSVTDMSSMFAGANTFNQPLNTWDVSLVTEMNGMFSFATSFNQPLNDWDVSSVTYMVGMFFDADSFNQPLNDWDVSSVSTMNNMFFDADSFNQPLNDWDVSSVRIMKSMFHGATSFNQPLNTWDVSKVTNMGGMFFIATSFNQPLNAWDVSSVTDMRSMFKDATAFNQPLNDWDVSSVTNMDEMFAGATAFDQDLSSWYVAPDSAVLITDRSRTLTVMPLSPYIGEQSLVYTVSDTRFVMDGRTLSLSSTNPPTASIYDLDITVTAVLDEPNAGNHTRTVTITVRDTPITPFITKWRTDSANQTITIPVGGSTARYSIDWGDSPVETDITGNSTHTYRDAGIHTVYISGNFERIHLDGQQPNAGRLTSIEQWGDIYWTNMSNAFAGASNMTYSAMDTPDLGLVSDMSRMFAGATIFDGDISGWDVSTVRDMSGMFYSAAAFNGEISNWDVSAARNMNHMFARATSFNQPLNGWDVSSVSDMGGMFTGASSFNHDLNDWDVSAAIDMGGMFTGATLFNQDLSDWYLTLDGPAVIIPGYPRSPAVLPLSPYLDGRLHAYSVDDTRFVMDGRTILLAGPDKPPPTAGNYSLAITTAAVLGEPNTDSHTGNFEITIRAPVAEPFITVWRTSAPYQSVTIPGTGHGPVCNIDWGDGTTAIENDVACHRTHTYEFAGNYRVSVSGGLERIGIDGRQPYADRLISIVQWGDTYWTSMRDAFRGASNMGYPATDTPNLSRVTGMSGMFAETGAFNGDISDWDVSSVRDMNRMFSRANSFNQPLDGWDVSKVTDMGGMFEGTPFDLPLNSWNVSSVITMRNMFYAATDFVQSLNDWDVSNVTDMYRMFSYSGIQQGLDRWDVSKVTNMHRMFDRAASFHGDISGWDVSSVTDMNSMFSDATSFNSYISGWDVSSVTDMTDMFSSSIFLSSFEQNLGRWYVTLDLDTIAGTGIPGVVGTISAQNQPLKNHSPTYVIVDGLDKNHFEIVSENRLNMTSGVSGKAEYSINVTASGTNVFESGNNWRVLVVRVSGDNNADLGGLTISSGTLSPSFFSSVTAYTASVDNSVTQVTVTPTASHDSATIAVNGITVTSGTGHIVTGLIVGDTNTVTVTVTAQDSTTIKTYTVTITRAAAALSDNADLGGLTISSGTLSPSFFSSVTAYTASVDNSVTQVTVTPTASHDSATIAVNGITVTSGTGHIVTGLIVGDTNTVTVTVTAQDSTTIKTYTVTITRAAAALSDNADLGGLTISSGTLSPSFFSSVTAYTASVDNSVTQVTVTPTASHDSATIAVNGITVTSGTGHIVTGLIVGDTNTVTVTVTAQDSTTIKTYTVTITRAAAALSDNADLGGLTISSGTLSPQFFSSVTAYTASVDNSVTQVTVTPTASHDSATIAVNGITVTSGTGHIVTGLIVGDTNTVTVTVTAQDSTTIKTYTVTVTVTGTPNTPIGDTSKKKSSSSKAPAVHINALAQARIIDIPPHIAEQVASHDASDPLEPITPDGTFDLPLVINGYGYLLDDVTNTLVSQTVTVGDGLTTITFTVYTQKDLAYFTLYLNLSDENIDYADSDTYITYKDDGTTSVTDPHGYIGSATVTVTQEDDQIPEKRTVRITIEFGEEPMGPTNMVAYMWNTDRKALFVKIINAFEVVAAPLEPVMQAADPEPAVPDSGLPADPEPVPRDTPWPDDYDDAQVLTLIRMWSGFESEFITDTQLLDLLGLEDYQDVDLPDWMMTELGVLVAKGDVTVGEFVLALQYVLTHA